MSNTYTSEPLLIAIDSYADNNQDVIIDYNYVNHVTMVWGTYNSHEGHYQYDDLTRTTIITNFEDCWFFKTIFEDRQILMIIVN